MDMFLCFNGPAKTFPVTCQASDAYKKYKPKEEENRGAGLVANGSFLCLNSIWRLYVKLPGSALVRSSVYHLISTELVYFQAKEIATLQLCDFASIGIGSHCPLEMMQKQKPFFTHQSSKGTTKSPPNSQIGREINKPPSKSEVDAESESSNDDVAAAGRSGRLQSRTVLERDNIVEVKRKRIAAVGPKQSRFGPVVTSDCLAPCEKVAGMGN
ncbi:unnamed protein product [Miscanthus lutarioriparius]|uniref:Uncharacterized protein n=1 Tax=Miscanthus lutarioriparius TaxID=422564 RepID=A0A811NAN0_9POAL|nr:unnamed protein product [Miscanthus lutarioriparius]